MPVEVQLSKLPNDWKEFLEVEVKHASGCLVTCGAQFDNGKKVEGDFYMSRAILSMSTIIEAIKSGKVKKIK